MEQGGVDIFCRTLPVEARASGLIFFCGGWSAPTRLTPAVECDTAAKLIVPLDTHMHRIGLTLGATKRKAADMRTALKSRMLSGEFCPRIRCVTTSPDATGIRSDMDFSALFSRSKATAEACTYA